MSFWDGVKSVYNKFNNMIEDEMEDFIKNKYEQYDSQTIINLYRNSNLSRKRREIIEEILSDRKDMYKFELNRDYIFNSIYSKLSKEELYEEYQYVKSCIPKNNYYMNLKETKLSVLEEKLGIRKKKSNVKSFNIFKFLFMFIRFAIIIAVVSSLIYFIVLLIKSHFDIASSFNKLQLIYKAVFDKLVTIWPFK